MSGISSWISVCSLALCLVIAMLLDSRHFTNYDLLAIGSARAYCGSRAVNWNSKHFFYILFLHWISRYALISDLNIDDARNTKSTNFRKNSSSYNQCMSQNDGEKEKRKNIKRNRKMKMSAFHLELMISTSGNECNERRPYRKQQTRHQK